MSTPADEAKGRKVLDVFAQRHRRAGDALVAGIFMVQAPLVGLNSDDLLDGVRYAGEAGWVEDGPGAV